MTNKPHKNGSSCTPIQQAYYRYLFDSSNFGIIGTDCQGIIINWNRAAEEIFSATAAHMLGQHVDRIVPEDRRDLMHRVIERAVTRQQSAEFEVEHRDEGGEKISLAVYLAPVLDEQGQILGLAAWVRDITRRKNLERQLTQSEKMASLGTLASGVAHHFNNIVGGVMTFVDFALQSDNPDMYRRALEMTFESTGRIAKITQSLLTFAEQDNRQFDLSDMTEVVLTFVHLVEKPLANKHIKIQLHIQTVPVMEVAGSRMHQVLGNLLDNAENAMPEGGSVDITLLTDDENNVILRFADTGCGIAPRDLPHIFEPFFTTRGVASGGNYRSAGLGLSVVHGIVHELGGTIEVESKPGEGTTFTLRFPISSGDKPSLEKS